MMIFRSGNTKHGGVLVPALLTGTILGITLGSYLLLVSAQNKTVVRSQAWNAALAMAEAGVEEALAQLNPGAAAVNVDRTANGWGSPAGGFYGPMSRTISSNGYSVVFTDEKYATIYSTGYVTVPALSTTLTRTLRVTTTNMPLYNVGLTAIHQMKLNGGGLTTDSFNSADPNLSDGGLYPYSDPSKTSTNGDVASLYGPVDPGNHVINGDLYLGPEVSYGGDGNNVTGDVYTDFNADFPDVVLPQDALWTPFVPVNLTIDGVKYTYVFATSGDWIVPALNGNVYIGTNANVRIRVSGNSNVGAVRVAGSGPSSGKVSIYMAGASFKVSGGTSVDGGNALNLSYFGLPSNTSISMSGNASFVGTIYAPQADLSLSGGGSSPYDFVGACITKSVTVNGHFGVHYDENLAKEGPLRGAIATSWREL